MVGALQTHAAQRSLDNRHSTAGCLLTLIFLVPIVARSCSPVLLLGGILLYVTVVVPILTGYFSPAALFRYLRRVASTSPLGLWIQDVVFQIWIFFGFLHFFYREMEVVQIAASQMLFCVLAERVFSPDEAMCGLIFLSFYNIVAYIIKALTGRQWSQLRLRDREASNVVRQTASFILARMNKGVATLSVLLTISYHAHRLEPSVGFLITSSIFFTLTQLQNSDLLIKFAQKLELEVLEGMEEWYFPLAVRIATISSSCILLALLLLQPISLINIILTCLIFYNNVFVAFYRLKNACYLPLCQQKSMISLFTKASVEDLANKGDSCPVCLERMKYARITPCGHIFHGSCLRRWAQQSYKCPMCMQSLLTE